MNRKAVIDVGSNSIKFIIGEKKDNNISVLLDKISISRLGEGAGKTGCISQEAMDRSCKAIEQFVKEAKSKNVNEIIIVGTMMLRNAANSSEFLNLVKDNTGLDINIISGEREAELSYLSTLTGFEFSNNLIVFDTGGGSTEFVFGDKSNINKKFSLNIGAVNIFEEFFNRENISKEDIEVVIRSIESELKNREIYFNNELGCSNLIGIGGTVVTLAAVNQKLQIYSADKIHGYKLSIQDIDNQIEMYRSLSIEERIKIPGIQSKRADIIIAGACIVKAIMNILKVETLIVSNKGLRHGLLENAFN